MDAVKPGTLEAMQAVGTADAAGSDSAEVGALVARAKGGDADAFADLVRLYERRIIALGLSMGLGREDALDACQDAFIKVFKYIKRFETGRSFFRWLYRIAIHAVYDQLRRTRGAPTISLDDLEGELPAHAHQGGGGPHEKAAAAEFVEQVRASLGSLTRRERIVFVLRDLQEVPTEEIGAILRLSQVTVRRHCMSARQKLRRRVFPHRP